MISLHIVKSYREVTAVCDLSLLGKRFEEGKFQLDIKESFYKGEIVSKEKAVEMLKDMAAEDSTFNIVGKESISAALEAGIISEENIGRVDGIPFSLVLL